MSGFNFVEFFMKIYQGNPDESSDPNQLMNLPYLVQQHIVKFTDIEGKFKLRKTCHKLRSLVDTTRHKIHKLVFQLKDNFIILSIDNQLINYSQHDKGCIVEAEEHTPMLVFDGGDFIDRCVLDLAHMLQNSKLFIQTFEVIMTPEPGYSGIFERNKTAVLSSFYTYFQAFQHKFQVENLKLNYRGEQHDLMAVLMFMKPGTLKSINIQDYENIIIYTNSLEVWLPFSTICQTDQYLQAKDLTIRKYKSRITVDQWIHFDTVNLRIPNFSLEELKIVVEKFLNTPDFRGLQCKIRFDSLKNDDFKEYIIEKATRIGPFEGKYSIRMGNREFYLDISLDLTDFAICQKHYVVPHFRPVVWNNN